MSSRNNKDRYRNTHERYYCAVCNVWMGGDRQSIALHENGKKHQQKVEEQMKEKRREKQQQESQSKALRQSIQQMEAAARASVLGDLAQFATTALPPVAVPSSVPPPPPLPPPPLPKRPQASSRSEKKEWEARKKQRMEEKKRPTEENDETAQEVLTVQSKRSLPPNEGFYERETTSSSTTASDATTNDDSSNKRTTTTYLEGPTFGDLLEEEMPIELWTGTPHATPAEQRLPAMAYFWIPALVVQVLRKQGAVHSLAVAYLKAGQEDETLEKDVPLARVRILLGATDDRIPDTVAEARILAGYDSHEEVVAAPEAVIDEATGLTAWTTVSIQRTSVRKELQNERARLREERRQKAEQDRQTEARRMEEAAVASAGDSALGAYDIWNRGEQEGYKGVHILAAADAPRAQDVVGAKKLNRTGQPVQFQSKKATAFKAKKKKKNMRRTSADDD